MTDKQKPVIQTRDRNLSASVFCREVDLKGDGVLVPMYSICIQRSYKRKDSQEWQRENINLNLDDCLRMGELVRSVYHKTLAYASANRPASQQQDYPAQAVEAQGFDDEIPF